MKVSGDLLQAPSRVQPVGTHLLDLIGKTPLVPLSRIERDTPGVRLFAKAEWFNPGGSVKDRAAASIIADAESRGLIGKHSRITSGTPTRAGKRLLDASSGNTALAYAMIGAAKGYPVTLCVPRNANPQVLALLQAYGAEVILTDPLQGSDGAIQEARGLAQAHPEMFVYLNQYGNPANWQAHYRSTALEVWHQTQGTVTHFVAGLGTTGTFTGTSRRLHELNPEIRAIAVQPDAALHGLEGLKHLESAEVPGIYDPTVPDETLFISTETAYEAARRLVEQEGILVGHSSGAALAGSLAVAKELSDAGTPGVVVMVFPDSGNRYATEGLFTTSNTHSLTR